MSTLARVITALDYSNASSALELARQLDPELTHLKVGKELFTAAGPALVEQLQALNFRVFLDLKFHDIPNTVAGAVRSAMGLGVWMVNVHAMGGRRMLETACEAAAEKSSDTLLIGVTVLTSMEQSDLTELGIDNSVDDQVIALAQLTQSCGLDGVVCSPHEAQSLRKICGQEFVLVTPGVRPSQAASADQRRVMTPQDAIAAGSNFLVIGRPITQAADPLKACEVIVAELKQ